MKSENNSVYNSIKENKILEIHSPKEKKDVYTQNYKTLLKEMKEDTNKQKDVLCSWIGRHFLRCSYYLEGSPDSTQSLSKF